MGNLAYYNHILTLKRLFVKTWNHRHLNVRDLSSLWSLSGVCDVTSAVFSDGVLTTWRDERPEPAIRRRFSNTTTLKISCGAGPSNNNYRSERKAPSYRIRRNLNEVISSSFFFLLSLSFTSCLCRRCLASCNVANVHRLDWTRRTLCGVDQNAACGQLGCWRLQNKFFFSECQATTPPACSLGCDGTRLDWTPPLALGTQTERLGGRGLKFNSCKCCHLSGSPHLCRVALVGEGFQFVLALRGSEPCISLSSFTLLSKVALESDYIFVVSLSFGSMNCILKHLERTK